MTDEEVEILLDSESSLVVVEAPAGCGKTYQGANLAARLAGTAKEERVLILTHTHAATAAFAKATRDSQRQVEIRTADSFIAQIAGLYAPSLALPADPGRWAQENAKKGGYSIVAERVCLLLEQNPFIGKALADRYPFVICDEHQDSSDHQHRIAMALHANGSKLRVFGDPMQMIFSRDTYEEDLARWDELTNQGTFCELSNPHRWNEAPKLGTWLLYARKQLKDGQKIDLSKGTPTELNVLHLENISQEHDGILFSREDKKQIDQIVSSHNSMLILSPYNAHTRKLRPFFYRTIPLWEGHIRDHLDELAKRIEKHDGDPVKLGEATVKFIDKISVHFTPSKHAKRLIQEIKDECVKPARQMPGHLQELARCILSEPNHVGVSKCLRALRHFVHSKTKGFQDIKFDHPKELSEAILLAEYDNLQTGISDISRRRSFSHPMPAQKTICNIHKAKGLQNDNVIVLPCDSVSMSDTPTNRSLLYVAMSRSRTSLTLVISKNKPPPLFRI